MDNLNTTQITLGNMSSVDVAQEEPQESKDTQNVDVAENEPESSPKPEDNEDNGDKSDNNFLIFGGLFVLLLLFKKKL